jgi:SNF2 family DNA or RNA helicase
VLDVVEVVLKSRYKWRSEREYERIDGTVPAEKRNAMIQRFNAETKERVSLWLAKTAANVEPGT